MSEHTIVTICILVGIIGILALIGLIYFGLIILRKQLFLMKDEPFFILEKFLHRYLHDFPNRLSELPRHIVSMLTEYLERRNEFWNTFGQVCIAILIIIILSILLITKSITAEAGLPILSGVSGFAIAKGVSGGKSINLPQGKEPQ